MQRAWLFGAQQPQVACRRDAVLCGNAGAHVTDVRMTTRFKNDDLTEARSARSCQGFCICGKSRLAWKTGRGWLRGLHKSCFAQERYKSSWGVQRSAMGWMACAGPDRRDPRDRPCAVRAGPQPGI